MFCSSGAALYCNFCESTESSDDCGDHNEHHICPDVNTVCYETHRVKNNSGTEDHFYQRGCGIVQFCDGRECVTQGQWCEVHCYNKDARNKSPTMTLNCMTGVMVGLLTTAHLF